jgi:serine/threonine-protein kinase
METYCTHPHCSQPINNFPELDERSKLQTAQPKYCESCGMPQILAGRYVPLKLLGKGGFGAAYLACDLYTPKQRKCVIKQFRPPANFNPKNLKIAEELFTREAEVLETLGDQHPQIPHLYAFFPLILSEAAEAQEEEKQFFYIVQEFINGETLEQEVKRKGKLNEEEIREILENMLKILQFVHENDSIHRDIKPSNIMRDQKGKLYLLDFGAVKRVTGANARNYSTGIYSIGFAPPEQVQGGQIYPSTDLYALAATCIRLATGKPIQELYDSYNNEWSWRSYTEISDQLDNVLERMLSFIPKHRFQSAQEVLDALQENTVSEPQQETLSTEAKTAQLPPEFIAFCQKELARYIGPMASLVCEEVIGKSSFPLTLVGYVEALAAEIPDPDKANQFIREVKRNHNLLDG